MCGACWGEDSRWTVADMLSEGEAAMMRLGHCTRLVALGALRASQLFDCPVGLVHGGIDASARACV
jgi:hypothetical protein